jgi:hypothetical protein
MTRKLILIISILAISILLGVYFLFDFTDNEGETFKAKVLTFKPELVTSMKVTDQQNGDHVEIILDNGEWILLSEDNQYSGSAEAITNTLAMLSQLKTESIAATKSDKWEEYKVDNKQAMHIEAFENKNRIAELYIGKFEFTQVSAQQPGRQPQTKSTTYVRRADEDMVYAVNGLLRSSFQGGINPFRNRILFFCDQPISDISKVTINGPHDKTVLDLTGPQWMVNGIPADSARTMRFLRNLSRLRSSTFMDDVDISGSEPAYSLTIEGKTFSPVSLHAYPADSQVQFYISSSANIGSIFNGAKGKIFEKIFVGRSAFLP